MFQLKKVTRGIAAIALGAMCILSGGANTVAAQDYEDTSSYPQLKELYQEDFLFGVAAEDKAHWGGFKPLNEIGDPAKEKLICEQFNSMTFGNELKPDCNMDTTNRTGRRTEEYLPFNIDSSAKTLLDFAKKNNIGVRGHVLVWHSQCPDAIFCKGYNPVYTDDSKKTLDPCCYVDAATLKKRMESYIDETMKYMYENGYGDVIYAWDVVNEAVEPYANNEYHLRNSYWYQIMGTEFIYDAFKAAKDSVNKYIKEGQTAPKLFYNDYQEYVPAKRDAILRILTEEVNGHSLTKEGLIDGMGMQSHISDNQNLDQYFEALEMYDEKIGEVHVTELDVCQTHTGVNAEWYQGDFYKKLFERYLEEKRKGVNLTCVTIWGLTDDNSWIKDGNPLLFRGNLEKKLAFDGVVSAVTGTDLQDPVFEKKDYTRRTYTFDASDELWEDCIKTRGGGTLKVVSTEPHSGTSALCDSERGASWHGISLDVTRFAGQTIQIEGYVKSAASQVRLNEDITGTYRNIATANTSSNHWVNIKGTYKLPSNQSGLKLYFETSDQNDIYLDDLTISVIGKHENFEEETNIAKGRGVGHVPNLSVVEDNGNGEGNHSLKITRAAQEASMKFFINDYADWTVKFKAKVKTADTEIALGIDGDTPVELTKKTGNGSQYVTLETKEYEIPQTATYAYIETNGTSDFYVDDIEIIVVKEPERASEVVPSEKPSTTPSQAPSTAPSQKPSAAPSQTPSQKPQASAKIRWQSVKGAKGYEIYGKEKSAKKYQLVKSVKSSAASYEVKKLKKDVIYQYQIKAYQMVKGKKKYLGSTQNCYVYGETKTSVYGNPTRLDVLKDKKTVSSISLKAKKSVTVSAKMVLPKGKKWNIKGADIRYATSNAKIASVSAKGKITAKKKGSCEIIVTTPNGLTKKIKIKVK